MKKFSPVFLLLLLFSVTAYAAPTAWQSPTELVAGATTNALKQITEALTKAMVSIIFALALLQTAIHGIKQMVSGEIDKTIFTLAMNFTWVGLALWLITGATNPIEPGVSNLGDLLYRFQYLAIGIVESMLGNISFSAGAILETGLAAYGFITLAVGKATATNVANALAALFVPGVSFMTILMTFFISVVIMLSCAYLALKVFITKIEFVILITIAPLNAALLVFAPTRDQGWAPFKGGLSLVYRILILGGTVAAIKIVAESLGEYVNNQAYGLVADIYTPLLSAAFAFSLLAFIANKSDAIASAMASGSSTLSTGDMAGTIAAGVAAGMTGGAALAATQAASTAAKGATLGDVAKGAMSAFSNTPGGKGAQATRNAFDRQPSGSAPQKSPEPDLSVHPKRETPPQGGGAEGFGAPADTFGKAQQASSAGSSAQEQMAKAASEWVAPEHASAGIAAFEAGGSVKDAKNAMVEAGAKHLFADRAATAMKEAVPNMPTAQKAAGSSGNNQTAARFGQVASTDTPAGGGAGTSGNGQSDNPQDNVREGLDDAPGKAGDGSTAGISDGSKTEKQLAKEKLMESLNKVAGHGSNLNQRIERDSASTHVSINTHHSD